MNRSTYRILVYLLALAIAWFPLTGFSTVCLDLASDTGSSHAVGDQLPSAHADVHAPQHLDVTPDPTGCDTQQHDCNGNHAQCSSGLTLILQSQDSLLDVSHAIWQTACDTALPGTHPAPAIRPPIPA